MTSVPKHGRGMRKGGRPPTWTPAIALAAFTAECRRVGRCLTQREVNAASKQTLPSMRWIYKHYPSYAAFCRTAGYEPLPPGRNTRDAILYPPKATTLDWRTTSASTPAQLQIRRLVIEQELWGDANWRLHRTRMQESAQDFDALLLREADRRRGGRPTKRTLAPMNVNA